LAPMKPFEPVTRMLSSNWQIESIAVLGKPEDVEEVPTAASTPNQSHPRSLSLAQADFTKQLMLAAPRATDS